MPKLNILKIGGHVINDPAKLHLFLKDFANLSGDKILVHGGGKKASQVLTSMGIVPKMIGGRRVTDEKTLEVVTMVYAGIINTNIVAKLQSLNCKAIGLTGADLNSILAHKRVVKDIDYGFAGDIDMVNSEAIGTLLQMKACPVFCAVTHDKKGQLLNTNADTIAAELASSLAKSYDVELRFCFEKSGVLLDVEDEHSLISQLSYHAFQKYQRQGIIYEGMIPKIENAFWALRKGVHKVYIAGVESIRSGYVTGTQLIQNHHDQ